MGGSVSSFRTPEPNGRNAKGHTRAIRNFKYSHSDLGQLDSGDRQLYANVLYLEESSSGNCSGPNGEWEDWRPYYSVYTVNTAFAKGARNPSARFVVIHFVFRTVRIREIDLHTLGRKESDTRPRIIRRRIIIQTPYNVPGVRGSITFVTDTYYVITNRFFVLKFRQTLSWVFLVRYTFTNLIPSDGYPL